MCPSRVLARDLLKAELFGFPGRNDDGCDPESERCPRRHDTNRDLAELPERAARLEPPAKFLAREPP